MDIRFIGVGTLKEKRTSGTLTYTWPTGYDTTVKNDISIVVQAGWRPDTSSTALPTPTGYTSLGTTFRLAGSSSEHVISAHYRILDGSESDPVITMPTAYISGSTYFLVGYSIIYRNVYKYTPFPNATTGASAPSNVNDTYTPAAYTTSVPNSFCLSILSSGDANSLSLSTANGFTARASGASYNSTLGDAGQKLSLGVADKLLHYTGSATQPTWKQNLDADDGWVVLTTAMAPYQWQPMPGMVNVQ